MHPPPLLARAPCFIPVASHCNDYSRHLPVLLVTYLWSPSSASHARAYVAQAGLRHEAMLLLDLWVLESLSATVASYSFFIHSIIPQSCPFGVPGQAVRCTADHGGVFYLYIVLSLRREFCSYWNGDSSLAVSGDPWTTLLALYH